MICNLAQWVRVLGSCTHGHMNESYSSHNALLIAIVNKLEIIISIIIVVVVVVVVVFMDRT
jgi:hypothetical protein